MNALLDLLVDWVADVLLFLIAAVALVGLAVGAVLVSPALIATTGVTLVAHMLHPAVPLRDFFKTRRRRFTGLVLAAALLVQTGTEIMAGGGLAAIAGGSALCACAVWPALHVARVFVGEEMPGIFEADAPDSEVQS